MADYETVLVPTDGSERAEEAVAATLELARAAGATVHALFVVDTHLYGEPALSSVELFVDELGDRGAELLSELVERGSDQGVTVERAVRHGEPHGVITDYAEEVDADLLVLGYQGESHRTRMGDVVQGVLEATDRHVLVV